MSYNLFLVFVVFFSWFIWYIAEKHQEYWSDKSWTFETVKFSGRRITRERSNYSCIESKSSCVFLFFCFIHCLKFVFEPIYSQISMGLVNLAFASHQRIKSRRSQTFLKLIFKTIFFCSLRDTFLPESWWSVIKSPLHHLKVKWINI